MVQVFSAVLTLNVNSDCVRHSYVNHKVVFKAEIILLNAVSRHLLEFREGLEFESLIINHVHTAGGSQTVTNQGRQINTLFWDFGKDFL